MNLDKAAVHWSCRRGMLELDLFIMNFFEAKYEELSYEDKINFVNLLAYSDLELWKWFIKRENIPEELANLVEQIRQYRYASLANEQKKV